jgi:hypothetical protein
VAETSGLLNRRTGFTRTEGSNPSVSANLLLFIKPSGQTRVLRTRQLGRKLETLADPLHHELNGVERDLPQARLCRQHDSDVVAVRRKAFDHPRDGRSPHPPRSTPSSTTGPDVGEGVERVAFATRAAAAAARSRLDWSHSPHVRGLAIELRNELNGSAMACIGQNGTSSSLNSIFCHGAGS